MSDNKIDPTDAVAGGLASLGPWGLIAGVALKFGAPFVTKLLENAQNKKPVTLETWGELAERIETPGEVLVPKRPGA